MTFGRACGVKGFNELDDGEVMRCRVGRSDVGVQEKNGPSQQFMSPSLGESHTKSQDSNRTAQQLNVLRMKSL